MKIFRLFLVIGAALQMVAHGAPITDRGVFHIRDDICRSEVCIKEAGNILKDLKKHMDPCIDFEQFVCGGFFERATTPGQTMMDDIMDKYTKKIAHRLMDAKDPNTPKPTPGDDASIRNIQRMHNYFAACMDETRHKEVGRIPLVYELRRMVKIFSVPGSPIEPKKSLGVTIRDGITGQFLGNSRTTFFDPPSAAHNLSLAIADILHDGLITFINLSVDQDGDDPTINRMSVNPGRVGLPTGAYDDPKITQPYQQLIGEMFYIFYNETDPVAGKDEAEPLDVPPVWKDVAKKVVDFEKEFAIFTDIRPQMDAGPRSQMSNKLFTVDDLNQLTPSLDWTLIFLIAYRNDHLAPKVVVVDEEYLKKLDALLSKTEQLTIQLFLVWSIIRHYGRFLDKAHRRNIDDYKLESDDDQDDRDEFCYKKTLEAVPDIIGHYFVEATLPKPA
ncbi:hypothetical protein BGX34_006237, partial [Mortierella sp. NVP85]